MLQGMKRNIATCLEWGYHLKFSERFRLGIRNTSHVRDDGVSALDPAHPREMLGLVLPLELEITCQHGPTTLQDFVSSGVVSPTLTTAETPCATNATCCQDAPVLPVLTEDTVSCCGPTCPYYPYQCNYLQESMKRCPVVLSKYLYTVFAFLDLYL